jgi:hypothetical protein
MKEQNELLEATEKLLEILAAIDDTEGLTEEEMEVIADTRKIVDQHRPKPKRLEGWLNLYKGYEGYKPGGIIWPTEQEAKQNCSRDARQVHIREVIPVEWEPWTVEMVRNHKTFQETADLHNAEMERVTK